ncbi:stage II sporulation protein P [Paenibacillus sp. JX-17]|uniref:Stage II sporulation protein P n=1 Tax=Paenibacillus lacisoli TaxID=3064525 RepID=A0ABT9CBY5_9BACL|nr:stage II sporulation protein P [Paenibacillus sp. JX-17]MDO7905487.1 stage II sporulation protein P [Paenibacillus sp. JX-17]
MKSIHAWNVGRWKDNALRVLAMGRTLVILMLLSVVFFVVLGLGGMAKNKLNSSPVSSMKGFAASVSSGFFMDMLGMEMPHLAKAKTSSSPTGEEMTTFMFQLLTGVNPQDPKTLVAAGVPGMATNSPVVLRKGSGNANIEAPEDYQPDAGTDDPAGGNDGHGGQAPDSSQTPDGGGASGSNPPPVNGGNDAGKKDTPANPPSKGSKSAGSGVLIYHSHPREAYNPLTGKESDNPNSSSPAKNVMNVGDIVASTLEKKGVGTIHEKKDYASLIKGYNWNFSYKYSRATVQAALAEHQSLQYLIDIHRDSQRHDKTTATINGVKYAKVYFIIGHENKNWKKNEAFAARIHAEFEKSYPGISRGVWGKDGGGGNNGEYNQSLSPNSILIEIGGIDNTQEELRRTATLLGNIVADLYWKDQKVQKVDASAKTNAGSTK